MSLKSTSVEKKVVQRFGIALFLSVITLCVPIQKANAQTWTQIGADINGEAPDDQSGAGVAISADGNRLAIGAPGNDGGANISSGHVRVYSWNGSGWIQLGNDIDGEASYNNSGKALSLSADGNTLAIGAATNGGFALNSGHVRVYRWNGSVWLQLGNDIDGGGAGHQLGWSVSLSADGNRVACGAPTNQNHIGYVQVYEYIAGSWVQLGANIAGEANSDRSGKAVSLSADGTRLAIGAYENDGNGTSSGHVRVYQYNGVTWVQMGGDLDGEAANDFSGTSVCLSSDGVRVAIGATLNDGNGISSGHVRIYGWTGTNWAQLGADIDGEFANDGCGASVSFSSDGNRVAIGANGNDGNGSNSGHVRIFVYNGGNWIQVGNDIDGEYTNDLSGLAVSLSSDGYRVAIGALNNDGNGNNSGHVRVFDFAVTRWDGSSSTDWNTAANWSDNTVPGSNSDVVIPNVANDPVIPSGNFEINDIELENGATLQVVSGGSLTLNGELDNSGSVTIQDGGSFLQGTGSNILGSGTFSIQRQGSSLYNMWGSPITAQSGVPGSSYEYVSSASTQDDGDDENDPGWSSYNGTMTPGKGYAGQGGNLATFTGTPNNGNVNYSLYYTAFDNTFTQTVPGTPFNLVSNPYPSAISAASFIFANSDIVGTIYFWNDNGSNNYSRTDYAYWNGTGGLGTGGGQTPNGYIGSCQGFMVRALNGGAVANFTNAMRVTGNNAQFHKESGQDSRMWFSVENADLRSEILIGLLEDATEDEDRLYDAVKLKGNPNISLSAVQDETEYAITAFPPPLATKSVPLELEISQAGTYSFKANTMENFEGYEVKFVDAQEGSSQFVHEGQAISINLSAGEYRDRFYLQIAPVAMTGVSENEAASIYAYEANGQLHIQFLDPANTTASIELFDMSGRMVIGATAKGNISIDINGIGTGVYILRAINNGQTYSRKIVKQ